MLGGLVVTTTAARCVVRAETASARVASLLAGLVRINLAMGKLSSVDALVGLTVLAKTAVL